MSLLIWVKVEVDLALISSTTMRLELGHVSFYSWDLRLELRHKVGRRVCYCMLWLSKSLFELKEGVGLMVKGRLQGR
ncbi:unnamed protein product [Camellia sinensis]